MLGAEAWLPPAAKGRPGCNQLCRLLRLQPLPGCRAGLAVSSSRSIAVRGLAEMRAECSGTHPPRSKAHAPVCTQGSHVWDAWPRTSALHSLVYSARLGRYPHSDPARTDGPSVHSGSRSLTDRKQAGRPRLGCSAQDAQSCPEDRPGSACTGLKGAWEPCGTATPESRLGPAGLSGLHGP